MQISRKRNKRGKAKLLEAILGLCLLAAGGCSPSGKASADSAAPVQDYSAFLNTKVTVSADTPLYVKGNDGFTQSGTFFAGFYSYIDVGDAQDGNYLPVRDTDFYIDGSAVKASGRWFQNRNHLIPYDQYVTTTKDYRLEDARGNQLAEIKNRADSYQVYVRPGSDDNRYGILYQGGIAFIPADGIADAGSQSGASASAAASLPVLMYHFFYSAAAGETRKDGNYVEVNEFKEQLQSLADDGYVTLSMREVQYFMEKRGQVPQKSVVLTIDDNDPTVHQYAYPLIKQYQANATLFVICGWAGATMPYDLIEMREDGIELQSHSFLMHQGGCSGEGHGGRLLCTDHDTGVQDTKESFDYVDGGFVYCYPFGDVNDSAESIVRDAGAKLAFTTASGRIDPSLDPLRLPRVRVHGGEGITAYMNSIQ